ncbi:MAG: redoxin family protein, partial [Duncaniella sp.]|nr:redoxin family protein [Duncaniella sp.]
LSAHQREVLEKKIQEIENRVKDGDKIPCDPVLVMPDGSKKTLTEACEGKVAYIDMWATWCGPCCAQIPYMEKMAEHYKNNDKVVCISISCDEDLEAWQRKLAQDKPEWPQYVFSGESGQQFMTALGVNGIPRFIILNPDMTIANIDAPRPQKDAEVKAIIDGMTAEK